MRVAMPAKTGPDAGRALLARPLRLGTPAVHRRLRSVFDWDYLVRLIAAAAVLYVAAGAMRNRLSRRREATRGIRGPWPGGTDCLTIPPPALVSDPERLDPVVQRPEADSE